MKMPGREVKDRALRAARGLEEKDTGLMSLKGLKKEDSQFREQDTELWKILAGKPAQEAGAARSTEKQKKRSRP